MARLYDEADISRVIEMAWEDRTPFEAIEAQFGLDQAAVVRLLRRKLKPGSFRLWRQRVNGRVSKHQRRRGYAIGRMVCPTQNKRQG